MRGSLIRFRREGAARNKVCDGTAWHPRRADAKGGGDAGSGAAKPRSTSEISMAAKARVCFVSCPKGRNMTARGRAERRQSRSAALGDDSIRKFSPERAQQSGGKAAVLSLFRPFRPPQTLAQWAGAEEVCFPAKIRIDNDRGIQFIELPTAERISKKIFLASVRPEKTPCLRIVQQGGSLHRRHRCMNSCTPFSLFVSASGASTSVLALTSWKRLK